MSESFVPRGGWNPVFTRRDKIEYEQYYLYIKPKHGEIVADMITQMIMYKKKFHLKYSEEQEEKIARVFIHSVKALDQGL